MAPAQDSREGEADMPELAIFAAIDVAAGQKDQILPLLKPHRDRCLKDKPGTLKFEILLPRDDDARVLLYEVYRDDAAFGVHRNSHSIARWREESAGMGVKVSVRKCALVD
jgi:quinol monooxygenase YgiN